MSVEAFGAMRTRKILGTIFVAAVLLHAGCSDLERERPTAAAVVGTWTAVKIDSVVHFYLSKSDRNLPKNATPSLEIRGDGNFSATNLPTAIGHEKAIVINSGGTWRLENIRDLSGNPIWELLLICTEPKRGVKLTFHRDRSGLYLKDTFDLDYDSGIEFRRVGAK